MPARTLGSRYASGRRQNAPSRSDLSARMTQPRLPRSPRMWRPRAPRECDRQSAGPVGEWQSRLLQSCRRCSSSQLSGGITTPLTCRGRSIDNKPRNAVLRPRSGAALGSARPIDDAPFGLPLGSAFPMRPGARWLSAERGCHRALDHVDALSIHVLDNRLITPA